MKIESVPGARKVARRPAGQFQRTFETPLNRLATFTEILLPDDAVKSGDLFVDTVVFEPTRIAELLAAHEVFGVQIGGATITANGLLECRALLAAAMGDSIDCYFSPVPKRFLLYADHDEYVTLFAHNKGWLSQIAGAFTSAGVKEVSGFQRSL